MPFCSKKSISFVNALFITSGVPATIGHDVLSLFREARAAQMPMAEISLHFASLRITARELRGGAIIFLFPQAAFSPTSTAPRL